MAIRKRAPREAVARDVAEGVVSTEAATKDYGASGEQPAE